MADPLSNERERAAHGGRRIVMLNMVMPDMTGTAPDASPSELEEIGMRLSLPELMATAAALRDRHHPSIVTYSRKVFVPLTRLCRDVCHYCTFATTPRHVEAPYLSPAQVLAIARQGVAAGCQEVLITLGDRPEARYVEAQQALREFGCDSTVAYIEQVAEMILSETGLLPHINAGVLTAEEFARLRRVSPSMGLMLETTSERLALRGGPHFGSPDKHPAARMESLRAAGRMKVPLTTGILVGIGETRAERIDSLVALRDLHAEYGHLQEIIIQNFRPKPRTKMRAIPAASDTEMLWTVAMARLILGAQMSIQAPPNLNEDMLGALIDAGVNDWGGVSPVTPDHINPEAPWPEVERLRAATASCGKTLTERLTVYPRYIEERSSWVDPHLIRSVLQLVDAQALARTDHWQCGVSIHVPAPVKCVAAPRKSASLESTLERATQGDILSQEQVARLFAARGDELQEVIDAADRLRRRACGDVVTYVVNRNINYTNLCTYHCTFCAFAKGRSAASLRGPGYLVEIAEIERRTAEAVERGATEVCLQGGIHPSFTGDTYLEICRAAKRAAPGVHVHAFSPLEIRHGADTLGISVVHFLERLQNAGLATLPGTAAEVLDDEVRRLLCPDKLSSAEWLEIVATAHRVGLRTTSTLMFGHIEQPRHWARHLLALRELQYRTQGLTEFVPLPFVASEAPLYRKGLARPGPTWREAVLMHAVSRLALFPLVQNIQASWVKLGPEGAAACLDAGANDIGGTLMNESISRAAGATHGQEFPPADIEALVRRHGRMPRQRTTLYGCAPDELVSASFVARPLAAVQASSARAARPSAAAKSSAVCAS